MKYMVMMHAGANATEELASWSQDDVKHMIGYMRDFNAELAEAGEFVDGQGLAFPEDAKFVRVRPDGEVTVTDGPFAEAKEFLMGFWILDVVSEERVIELAKRISLAPGKGGEPVHQEVEIRPIGEEPPV
ncbi:hypothetical protein EV193_1011026 [Herbihabitans rhizosphaerae]|uniref:YCII-related domain-containing protein n=1 Tax=Herbihabitans rhizosphaerae TaxID=1872711 RepID=A0A4Q7L638_9PSEU|nr:YciI family protein [Herbihabitans rhizosphaerae]RZS45139.1 hypothetical protein EV193_1011026 [Herbihabitans rhizosphaerae]